MKVNFKKIITPFNILKIAVIISLGSIFYNLYKNTYGPQLEDFRKEKDHYFRTSINSPIEDKIHFKGLEYFPPDSKFKVSGKVIRIPGDSIVNMRSSDGKKLEYIKYGRVFFSIDSIQYKLVVYQQTDSSQNQKLFLPFSDKTSGEETYISGRYLDLDYPKDHILEIDFNKAYHPYCVYSYKFSCPLPPQENFLNYRLFAGEKLPIEPSK